jgi:hypothetical protein
MIGLGGAVAGTLVIVAAVALLVWLLGGRSRDAAPAISAATATAAPDISNMTPREQFQRLADRVQTAVESNNRAEVTQFLPMVEGAYQNLLPGDRDIDARFHIALLRAQTGNPQAATAEIDSILTAVPDHLFGHYLRAVVADIENRPADARAARDAYVAAYREQLASSLPEYDAHKPLLEQFQRESGGTP